MNRIAKVTWAVGFGAAAAALAGCAPDSPVQPEGPAFATASATRPPFVFPAGCCFYEGRVVRTVVPPAAAPQTGTDNFYGFPAGAAAGQKGVVGVAPGDRDYQGGHWAFHAVTWNVTPYLLTSEASVLAAAAAGDVAIARLPDNDFKCPIQP
ncbi:MAG: hypothetical protein HYS40_00380 [Gemmatimonadetes bacterium]|nr:hypothetical protein [Gemmatimonadota bacterium]